MSRDSLRPSSPASRSPPVAPVPSTPTGKKQPFASLGCGAIHRRDSSFPTIVSGLWVGKSLPRSSGRTRRSLRCRQPRRRILASHLESFQWKLSTPRQEERRRCDEVITAAIRSGFHDPPEAATRFIIAPKRIHGLERSGNLEAKRAACDKLASRFTKVSDVYDSSHDRMAEPWHAVEPGYRPRVQHSRIEPLAYRRFAVRSMVILVRLKHSVGDASRIANFFTACFMRI
jgi:hypothetical protein